MKDNSTIQFIGLVLVTIALAVGVKMNTPSSPATSATPSTSPTGATSTSTEKSVATIETTMGTIKIELFPADAPKTVENFRQLAAKGYYDGIIFHRVIKGFMNQTGDPKGTGTGGESIYGAKFEDEINPSSPLYKTGYKDGVVAMANAGPNTNGSQFFIMAADYGLPANYTIFGRVVSGLDVVHAINNVKTSGSDRPVEDVKMVRVTVEPAK